MLEKFDELQKKLEEAKNEKNVIENKMQLRRDRHTEEMTQLKQDYANKIWQNTGSEVMTDTYVKELEDNFEKGLIEEFGAEIEEADKKVKSASNELNNELKVEIEKIDNELQAKWQAVEDKKKEIEEITHEKLKIARSPEADMYTLQKLGENEQNLQSELNKLLDEHAVLENEKEEMSKMLGDIEPMAKESETPEQEEKSEPLQEQEEKSEPSPEQAEESTQQTEETSGEKIDLDEYVNKYLESDGNKHDVDLDEYINRYLNSNEKEGIEYGDVEKIYINIDKYGTTLKAKYSKISDPRLIKATKLSNNVEIEPVKGIEPDLVNEATQIGDKFVVREIMQAAKGFALTPEQAQEQLQKYVELLKNGKDAENSQLDISLSYNLKGIRKSGLSREELKLLEKNAKIARDLGIANVTAGPLTRIKWFAQDVVQKFKQKALAKKETPALAKGVEENAKGVEENAKGVETESEKCENFRRGMTNFNPEEPKDKKGETTKENSKEPEVSEEQEEVDSNSEAENSTEDNSGR